MRHDTSHHTKTLSLLLDRAKADPEILAVMVFGSAARGEQGTDSDMDICLVLMPSRVDQTGFSTKRLDYAQIGDLDVSIFQALPLYIRRRVLKEGRIEFVRDEDALYEVAYRTAQAYEDFHRHYHDYLNQVASG